MINISFLGDISLNDDYIKYSLNGVKPFNNMAYDLSNSDYIVGNLECMIKGTTGENLLKSPRLSTTEKTLNYLKDIHLNIAALANNHIYDNLEDGFLKTKHFLSDNYINSLGAGLSKEEASKPIILNENKIAVGLLNYVTEDTHPGIPLNSHVYVNDFNIEKVKHDIDNLKDQVDHVVLFIHWGGRVENGSYPDINQSKLAKQLIDMGVDLIVGHHSHTIQPYEVYKNKLIVYSLGNFCFSNFSFEGETTPLLKRNRITSILSVQFHKDDYKFNFKFFENKGEHYNVLPNYLKRMKFKKISLNILFTFKFMWYLYLTHITYFLPLYLFLTRKDISAVNKSKRIFMSLRRRLA